MKKRKKLPHNYLDKYININVSKADYLFIKGCIAHQKNYFQLNNLQWKAIEAIESKYFLK